MNCRELRPFWPMFLDGELTEQDTGPYIEHLGECDSCARNSSTASSAFAKPFAAKSLAVAIRYRQPLRSRQGERARAAASQSAAADARRQHVAGITRTLYVDHAVSVHAGAWRASPRSIARPLPLDVSTHDAHEAQKFVDKHVPTNSPAALQSNKQVQLTGARVVDFPGHHGAMVRYLVGPKAQSVSIAVYRADTGEAIADSALD